MERSVRLALISDIHANLEALEATFYDIAERSIDRIVCLGDIVGYNSDAAACIALIRGAGCVCVAGNHDLAVCGRITTRKFSSAAARAVAWTRQQLNADDLNYLENLPLKANIGNRVIAVHGALHPETDCASVRLDNDKHRMQSFDALMTHPSGARICAFGHTHHAAIYELRANVMTMSTGDHVQLRDTSYYLINPGTIGEPRSVERRATYMILDLERRTVTTRYVDYRASAEFVAAHQPGLASRIGLAGLGLAGLASRWRG
jgi:predicted phosphodiesterase